MKIAIHLSIAFVLSLFFAGCTTVEPVRANYTIYKQYKPKSILILPPMNETSEIKATNAFLATVSAPLAEKGYYVFPVTLVDKKLKNNGVTTAGDMHRVALDKLREVFGADAVLYITIRDWATKYMVIDSYTEVDIHYRLVDLRTGQELWNQDERISHSLNQNNSEGLAGMVAAAIVGKLMSGVVDLESDIARQVNYSMFNNPYSGLLDGHRKIITSEQH